jgi:hypothetical protein
MRSYLKKGQYNIFHVRGQVLFEESDVVPPSLKLGPDLLLCSVTDGALNVNKNT